MEKRFNQVEYINEFDKKTYKKYAFRVRRDNTEIIDWLDSIQKKNEYILKLIKDDMAKK